MQERETAEDPTKEKGRRLETNGGRDTPKTGPFPAKRGGQTDLRRVGAKKLKKQGKGTVPLEPKGRISHRYEKETDSFETEEE